MTDHDHRLLKAVRGYLKTMALKAETPEVARQLHSEASNLVMWEARLLTQQAEKLA